MTYYCKLSSADRQASGPTDDNQSIDGSEHSLHIDLPEEQGSRAISEGDDSTNPFQQYIDGSLSASSANAGISYSISYQKLLFLSTFDCEPCDLPSGLVKATVYTNFTYMAELDLQRYGF